MSYMVAKEKKILSNILADANKNVEILADTLVTI